MFCVHCGTQLPDIARFCSGCGKSLAGVASPTQEPAQSVPSPQHATSPSVSHHGGPPQGHHTATQDPSLPSYESQAPPPQAHNGPQTSSHGTPVTTAAPSTQNTVLLGPTGYPQPAFESLAASLFHGLDKTIAPQRTGMLEATKMSAYRTLGGLTIPPFFAEHVLPTYCSILGVELAPGRPRNQPTVTWAGWHIYLLHKIRLEPEATFMHLIKVGTALGVPLTLRRSDFPATPDPAAQAKEAQFRTQIYAMANSAFGAGRFRGVGMRGHGVGAGAASHGHGQGGGSANEGAKLAFGILKGAAKFANNAGGGGMMGGGMGGGSLF